jgi:hypothetical protein
MEYQSPFNILKLPACTHNGKKKERKKEKAAICSFVIRIS